MAEIEIRVLDVLLRRVSPDRILQQLRNIRSIQEKEADSGVIQQFAITELNEYTLDEQDLIIRRLQAEAAEFLKLREGLQTKTCCCNELSVSTLAMYSVIRIAKQFLDIQEGSPVCKIEKVLPWRDAFLRMGQDLFICAFLADKDISSRCCRRDFTWPPVIKSNHAGLNSMLKQGLAENHQHLYGSSQTMALSWCKLMNYPERFDEIGHEFENLFRPAILVNTSDEFASTNDCVRYACLCRSHLFRWINSQEYGEKAGWEWLYELHSDVSIIDEIRRLRYLHGAKVPQPDGSRKCLDYALQEQFFLAAPDAPYRSLAGERALIYRCFRSFLQGNMCERMQMVFLLYIQLKLRFRSELIQVNQALGFRNFSNYQGRKTLLCEESFYQAELVRMAIVAPLQEGGVTSLETRISPKFTKEADIQKIREIEELVSFADNAYEDLRRHSFKKSTSGVNKSFFYVFHFIKRPDDDPCMLSDLNYISRHHRLREEIRRQAIALAGALSESREFCCKIRGIDCASHEIGCPPEVFATAFRFLRNFSTVDFRTSSLLNKYPIPRLYATYHAGEDFLDIASALRTIDEAVVLLELKRGDRIGHAIGLGIEPNFHYELKGKHVFMRKQDRLDDIVWLLYRSRELGVHMDAHLYGKLKKDAEVLLLEIYGEAIQQEKWNISLTEYHCSMQLRADSPDLYATKCFKETDGVFQAFDEWKISKNNVSLDQYRHYLPIAGMYYYYHYGKREKILGSQVCEVIVETDYIHLMRQVQDAVQRELRDKGIVIECNPSSNILIGSFRKYEAHPIFRFNNRGLVTNTKEYNDCYQLQVCINTDDLGVFDTSQEFEYALLFDALSKVCNPDGTLKYKEDDILTYLDNVRRMGIQAVFPENSS